MTDSKIKKAMLASPAAEFLGLGAQKCATTWLYHMLDAHPDCHMIRGEDKDTRFFSAYYDFGTAWYDSHYENKGCNMMAGEFSTSYLYSADAPARAFKYNPELKLIACIRDPVDRLMSNHKHEIRIGHIPTGTSIAEGISNNPAYVEQSRYVEQIKRWYQYFPEDRLHLIVYEELLSEPVIELARLYEYLGLDSGFVPDRVQRRYNEAQSSDAKFAHRAGRLIRRVLDQSGLRRRRGQTSGRKIGHEAAGYGDSWDTPEVRSQLSDLFLDSNKELEDLLGRKFLLWSKSGSLT